MDFLTKLINGLMDKGGLVVIGGACVFFFKQGKLPHFMGPVGYGITTIGALGVIRYIVMDLEKDKCDDLILELDEVKPALDNKIHENKKIKDLAEFIAEKRDLLQGWRQDSVRLEDKVKAVITKSSLHIQISSVLISECNVGKQANDPGNVCETSSTNETNDEGDLTKESDEKRDLVKDTPDLDDLITEKLESENKEENKAKLARSDASTGSQDSLESKELAEELETILAELEKIPKSIVKPRRNNVARFYEDISSRLSSERLEGQSVGKLKQAQGESKNIHGKVLTKAQEIVEKHEEKKHPRWEASAETGAIKKSEKKHEAKRHLRKEKHREHKDSHGKGICKENFEKSPQQDSQGKGNWSENLEKIKQLHKAIRDIPEIKIHLVEVTQEESVIYNEKMESQLEDSCEVEGKLQETEENRNKLTEAIKDYQEEKENYEKSNELLEENRNITDDAVVNIPLERVERTSIESENSTEKILHVKTEEKKDELDLNDIKEEIIFEENQTDESEEKQENESQSILSTESRPEKENDQEIEEKHEDSN